MPLIRRKPEKSYEPFRTHVAKLVRLVDRDTPVHVRSIGGLRYMLYLQPEPKPLDLDTKFGRLYFHLAQTIEAEKTGRKYRLRTRQYWYRLQDCPDLKSQALIRWEYDRDELPPEKARPPRNHVQLPVQLPAARAALDLNKLHVPTGWVLLGSVFRFLIVDLGVKPLRDDWLALLNDGERKFRNDFT